MGKVKSLSSGFSLVEVMMGLLVVSMIAMGAFASLGTGFNIVEDARDVTRVSQMLQAEIERLRVMPWVHLNDLPESADFMEDAEYDGVFERAFPGRYRGLRTIRAYNGRDDQLEVIVSVFWTANGREFQRSYRTVFTREGLNDFYRRIVTS